MKKKMRDQGLHGLIAYILVGIMVTMGLTSGVAIETPLHEAVREGNLDRVRFELEHGSSPDEVNRVGFRRIYHNSIDQECLHILLRNDQGETPLDLAARAGRMDIVELLLQYPTMRHPLVLNGLDRTIESETKEQIRLVSFDTVLHHAVAGGNLDVLRVLLGTEANPSFRNHYNRRNPLDLAAEAGRMDMVQLLLGYPRGIDGAHTALFEAAQGGHLEIVRLLLADPRVDPNLSDERNLRNPLHGAVMGGNIAIVRLLLADPRVNPNHVKQAGQNVLHLAAQVDRPDIMELLLADPRIDPHLLQAVGMIGMTPLQVAATRGHVGIVGLLLADPRVDPNHVNQAGQNVLHLTNRPGMMEFLLAHPRINPSLLHVVDALGRTPLDFALAWAGNPHSAVPILLSLGL